MPLCEMQMEAVRFVESSLATALKLAKKTIQDAFLSSTSRIFMAMDHSQREGRMPWDVAVAKPIIAPSELPIGCLNHLIILAGRYPTLMLTERLLDLLMAFTQDFRQMQRYGSFFNAEMDSISEQIKDCDEHLESLRATKDEMEHILNEQGGGEHPEDFVRVEYSDTELKSLNTKIDKLVAIRNSHVQASQRCLQEMREVRSNTLEGQYDLCNTLHSIFQEAGMRASDTEQWKHDRREIQGQTLRDLHRWATEVAKFPFAQDYVLQDWKTQDQRRNTIADTGDIQEEDSDDALSEAINEFEMCHWNRRIARDDFERRREHAEMRKYKATMKGRLLPEQDADELQELDTKAIRESQRLTKRLTRAEISYRDAVRQLRELGQEVETVDSSHFSVISTQAPSVTPAYTQMVKGRNDHHVDAWRNNTEAVDPATLSPARTPVPSPIQNQQRSRVGSIRTDDGYSVKAGPAWGTEKLAMRARAWTKEKERRNRRSLQSRRRRATSSNTSDGSLSDGHSRAGVKRRKPTLMQHLAKRRRGQFPVGEPPPSLNGRKKVRQFSFESTTATGLDHVDRKEKDRQHTLHHHQISRL